MSFTATDTVGQIVRNSPAAVGVFERLGIDFCCGGNRSLAEACEKAQRQLDQVFSELEASLRLPPIREDCHWLTCSLSELTEHLVTRHHDHTRRELPALLSLAAKVANRHGATRPETLELQSLVGAMETELSTHMGKEESILFPALRQMERAADGAEPAACFPAFIDPIRRMMEEHNDAGELLRRIRTITDNYTLPANACMTYQALYRRLKEFEEDLHRHIHLENNILFPRALEFEKSQRAQAA